MRRLHALAQGGAVLVAAVLGAAGMGFAVRVFIWAAGLE